MTYISDQLIKHAKPNNIIVLERQAHLVTPIVYDLRCIKVDQQSEDTVRITFPREISDMASRSVSYYTSKVDLSDDEVSLLLTTKELKTLQHDCVCRCLLKSEPGFLGKISNKATNYDMLTPDSVDVIGDVALVSEVKTFGTSYYSQDQEKFVSEHWKYFNPMIEKLKPNGTGVLNFISVFTNCVHCSNEYPIEILTKAVELFNMALEIKRLVEARSNLQVHEMLHCASVSTTKERFLNIKRKAVKDDCMIIDETFIKRATRPKSETIVEHARAIKETARMSVESEKRGILNFQELKKKLRKLSLEHGEEVSYLKEYKENISKIPKKRETSNKKSTFPLPIALFKWGEDFDRHRCLSTSRWEPEEELWHQSLRDLPDVGHLDWLFPKVASNEEHVYDVRSKRFTLKVKIRLEIEKALALKGVKGKKHKSDTAKLNYHEFQKKGFSLENDVTDIDEFVQNFQTSSWSGPRMDKSSQQGLALEKAILDDLLKQASSLGGSLSSNFFDEGLRKLMNSDFFQSLRQLELILNEVNFSRLTNLKEQNEYIFKRVPNLPCCLCIAPSRANRHIFFSLIVEKSKVLEIFPAPIKQFIESGDYLVSEFVSTDQDRLSHMLNSCGKLMALYLERLSVMDPVSFRSMAYDNTYWLQECSLMTLVFLEDKAQTSTALQNVRYAYMSLLTPPELMDHPLKVLNKMPLVIRSRLLVWCLNHIIQSFQNMWLEKILGHVCVDKFDPDIKIKSKESLDRLKGFKSWVTGMPLRTFPEVLDLSYLSHLHNKEEGDVNHGYLQIFTKIVKEEIGLRQIEDCNLEGKGKVTAITAKSHEFNFDSLSYIGTQTRQLLEEKCKVLVGSKSDEGSSSFEWYLLDKLNKLKIENLGTLKASAVGVEESLRDDPKDKSTNRTKAMINLLNLYKDKKIKSTNVVEAAHEALDIIESRKTKGILVNLFKKQQIGGTREIFVLEMADRIAIYLLEQISRFICELLDNEMLTKPEVKIVRSDEHSKKVRALTVSDERFSLTGVNSSDATTWCQRFTMPIFGAFLFPLLPKCFHNYLTRVLNAVTRKRLQLPNDLLKLWKTHRTIGSFNPDMDELKNQFFGMSKHKDLLQEGSRALINRSNFMQGIMHYTSSLLHASVLRHASNLVKYDLLNSGLESVITTKCSSDDSSVCISIVSNEKEKLLQIGPSYLRRACLFFNNLYWIFGAKSSLEKSTIGVLECIEEFNSVWLIKNTVTLPLIKFMTASFRFPPTGTLDLTIRNCASSRSQLLSAGASFLLTHAVQVLQGISYYQSLGLYNSQIGADMFNLIKDSRSPMLGYYIAESKLCSGLLGFDYSYYHLLTQSSISLKIHLELQKQDMTDLDNNLEHYGKISIGPGGLARYKDFINVLCVDKSDLDDELNKNPEKLYKDVTTPEDLINSIKVRALNYKSSEAFSGQKDSTTYSRGSFLPTSKVLTKREWDNMSHKITKYTWAALLREFIDSTSKSDREYERIANGNWKSDFLLSNFYDETTQILSEFEDTSLVSSYDRKRLVCSRTLRPFANIYNFPILETLNWRWFQKRQQHSQWTAMDLELFWTKLTEKILWLRETITESLELSPFSNQRSMAVFLKSLGDRVKSMNALCPMTLGASTENFIRKCIKWNQCSCHSLTKSKEKELVKVLVDSQSDLRLSQIIYATINLSNLPNIQCEISQGRSVSIPQFSVEALALSDRITMSEDAISMLDISSQKILYCLTYFKKMKACRSLEEKRKVFDQLINTGQANFVNYFIKQNRVMGPDGKSRWMGKIGFHLYVGGSVFTIYGADNKVQKIECKNVAQLLKKIKVVISVLKQNGLTESSFTLNDPATIYVSILNGKVTNHKSLYAVPVLESQSYRARYSCPLDPDFSLRVEPSFLQLVETQSNTTMISVPYRTNYLCSRVPEELLKEIIESLPNTRRVVKTLSLSYVLNETIGAGSLQQLIKRYSTDPTIMGDKLKAWFIDLCYARLTERGLRKNLEDALKELDITEKTQPDVHLDDKVLLQMLDMEDEDPFDDFIADFDEQDDQDYLGLLSQDNNASEGASPSNISRRSSGEPTEDIIYQNYGDSILFGEFGEDNIDEHFLDDFELVPERTIVTKQDRMGYTNKTFMDQLLRPLFNLTNLEVKKLSAGIYQESEASEDVRILCGFFGWQLKQQNNDLWGSNED